MYGLIGKMTATPGNRDELAAALLEGLNDMPGCLSYIVAENPENVDALWITEVWDSAESHQASLALPQVQVWVRHKGAVTQPVRRSWPSDNNRNDPR